jgi:hypothetical protein
MGIIAPTFITVNPSFIEPDIVVSYSQVSGAFELLPDGAPRTKLGEDDMAVYVKRLDIRTKMASGQAAYNMLPNVTPVFSYLSTPTYLMRVQAQWDHHDASASSRWGAGIQQMYSLGTQQAHYQLARIALLYGINPAFGEGITNSTGAALSVNLPPDTNGNDTIVSYDNGQMGFFLAQTIGSIKTRTNNLGIGREFTICAPQQVMQQWDYSVVQLTQYQRPGAGTESTAGLVQAIAGSNGDVIKFVCDDTLIGKGAGGTDLIVFVMPEVAVPKATSQINTNVFAKITPGFLDCTAMYCDMVAPKEIMSPLAFGATSMLSEHRISSGWPIRPEAVTLLSAQFQ